MTEEITLERVCNKLSWGFRLTGGRDFGSPLTVSRIHGGSISEKGGLQVGDIITHIGSEKASQLTHADAQRCIIESGNILKLSVLRGSCPDVQRTLTPVRVTVLPELAFRAVQHKKAVSIASSVYSLYEDDSFELLEQSDDEFLDEYHEPTEKEIDEMLLENAEVLEENGKTVLGVNFHRFIPKCDFIKDSAVFAALQEEQVHKELSEREQLVKCPNKRFSTFLAPPDRPIPTPKRPPEKEKERIEENAESENNGSRDTMNTSSSICCYNEKSTCKGNEGIEKFDSLPSAAGQSESLGFLEKVKDEEQKHASNEEKRDESTHHKNDPEGTKIENQADGQICIQEVLDNDEDEDDISKTDSEKSVEFETQLKNIKNTLNTLGELPSMIQSHLQNIQNQINNLLKRKTEQDKNSSSNKCNFEIASVNQDTNIEAEPIIEEYDVDEESVEDDKSTESYTDYEEELNKENEMNDEMFTNEASKHNERKEERIDKSSQGPEKLMDDDLELRKRRICPLTPLPRPVVLPGGRIWRKPQDAYNEEFIAETLISQAEVLVGSTLGVNFRKYEPPKFDMSNSAVYKLIHNIESKKTGLENRDKMPALQDYYQSPIKAKHFYLAKLAERVHSPKESEEKESQVS